MGSNPKLGEALKEIIELFKQITEFSADELKAISLLQTDKYYQQLLAFYILNRKHVKRKYAKEILNALEKLSQALAASTPSLPFMGFGQMGRQTV